MLSKVQDFIDSQISLITAVNKRWIDVFLPSNKNNENQVLIRLVDTDEIITMCGNILYTIYRFEIFAIGSDNFTNSREVVEEVYNAFNSKNLNNFTFDNINIGWSKARNLSFQFLESDLVSVNKFNLELMVEKKY